MKLNYLFFQGSRYEKAETPTPEDRINFLESTLRRAGLHEPLCESRRPEFVERGWFRSPKVTKPYDCDCWLSEPFGTVGLREYPIE